MAQMMGGQQSSKLQKIIQFDINVNGKKGDECVEHVKAKDN